MNDHKPALLLFVFGLFAVGGLVAYGLLVDEPAATTRTRDGEPATATVPGGAGGGTEGPVVIRSRGGRGPRLVGDGGVGESPAGARPRATSPAEIATAGAPREQNGLDEAAESAGWRLGRRRHQLETLESRATRLEERVAQLRQDGREGLAVRQQRVVDRTRSRAGELREEIDELAVAAAAEGSLDDAEEGYEESEAREAGGARATLPTP